MSDEQWVSGWIKNKMGERRCALVALVMLLLASPARAANPYSVVFERDVAVSMRDGVKLRADIYRPDGPGKFPVLLQRTPYNKNGGVEFGLKAADQSSFGSYDADIAAGFSG